MHVHVSLLDRHGRNVFAAGDEASPLLGHAIGGLLATMPEAMAVFAPNPNSYRRFRPNMFVPVSRSWSRENRSVAIRVPLASDGAWRIEHRVPGADANPYLVLAAILAGIHHGISARFDPGPPFAGNAGSVRDEGLPFRLPDALRAFVEGQVVRDCFGERYVSAYTECKTREMEKFETEIPSSEFRWYLR
jgi:glutamine synthetase